MCSRCVARTFEARPDLSVVFANVFDNESITCSDIEHTID